MFEKVSQVAKNVGTSIYTSTKEQSELAGLKVSLVALEKKLEGEYAQIGKAYVEYIGKCDTEEVFQVDDIIEAIKPELEKKAEMEAQVAEYEQSIKVKQAEKEKKKAEDEFNSIKKKLDKALEIDIITETEYEEKLLIAQKKLDNYDKLRKIDMQYAMGIIDVEEYEAKKQDILA